MILLHSKKHIAQIIWNSRFENIASRIDRIYLDSAWLLNVKKKLHPSVFFCCFFRFRPFSLLLTSVGRAEI